MKKIVRLTETDLTNIVKQVINENRTVSDIINTQVDPFIASSVDKFEDVLIKIQDDYRRNGINGGENINRVRSYFMESMIDLKKQLKSTTTKQTTDTPKELLKSILAEEKFYENNPEARVYENKIEDYKKKGLSLDDAYLLASKSDREIEENRNIY